MSNYKMDDRTRLLLRARAVNGIQIVVDNERDWQVMQQMVREGLFSHSDTMFSKGYWWTRAGERAAEEAWQRVPVQNAIKTRYRDHPQVRFSVNGNKEELCHVTGPNYRGSSWSSGLWVRESFGQWLVDYLNGKGNKSFGSADQAIEWALKQVGKAR